MTRDDIRKAFPEATDEQISGLLNIHSADIGRAKGDTAKLQADLKAAQEALEKANGTIGEIRRTRTTRRTYRPWSTSRPWRTGWTARTTRGVFHNFHRTRR